MGDGDASRVRIHIGHHYFGCGNIGDDLTVAGFAHVISRFPRPVDLTCPIFSDPASQIRRFPFIQWQPYTRRERERSIMDCAAWLGLGDSPFQSSSGSWFMDHLHEDAQLCRRYGKPMYFLGVGVNDQRALTDPIVLSLLEQAEQIWTRDRSSLELLLSARPHARVVLGADLANIELATWTPLPLVHDQLGFVLNFEALPVNFLADFVAASDRLSRRTVVWMKQEVRKFPWSESKLMDLFPEEVRSRFIERATDYANGSISGLIESLSGVDTLITSRYHAALIGAWQGSRLAVYCRNEKLQGLARDLDTITFDDFRPGTLESALDRSKTVKRELLEQLARTAETAASNCLSFASGCTP